MLYYFFVTSEMSKLDGGLISEELATSNEDHRFFSFPHLVPGSCNPLPLDIIPSPFCPYPNILLIIGAAIPALRLSAIKRSRVTLITYLSLR